MLDAITNTAIAIGTIAVAVIAIWGRQIRSWLVPPKLSLVAHNLRGDPNVLTADGKPVGRVMYYHLKVVNERPWLPVKNCRVLLRGLSRRGPDNLFHPTSLVVPTQLTWAPASIMPTLVTVTRAQVVDLGYIVEGEEAFAPALYSTPNNFQGFVKSGDAVRFELAIEADNFCSEENPVFEVAWDGVWEFEPGQTERHLRIRVVDEP